MNNLWQPSDLSDELIRLVPFDGTEFELLYAVASDPLIWEQHPAKNRCEREVFRQFYDSGLTSNSAFSIIDQQSGATIGSTRFYNFDPEKSAIAIGYTFLARSKWGGKYNQAMKKLMLDFAFQHVDSVFFHVDPNNIRSIRAVQKLGARKDADIMLNGKPHLQFVINSEDYKSRRS